MNHKIKQTLLLIFCLFFLFSCKNNQNTQINDAYLDEIDFFKIEGEMIYYPFVALQNVKTDWGKLGLRGKVKSMKVNESTYYFHENGTIDRIEFHNQDYSSVDYFIYNKKGQLSLVKSSRLVSINGKKENHIDSTVYKYKEDGMLENAVYSKNGIIHSINSSELSIASSKYDATGQLILFDTTGANYHYKYSEQGRCIEKKYDSPGMDGVEHITCSYMYNENRDIIKEVRHTIYELDSYINEPDETYSKESTYSYIYDEHKNWVERTESGNKISTKRTFEYYPN